MSGGVHSCEDCRFAVPSITDDGEPLMFCHRYPPQLFVDDDGELAQSYPEAHNGCGEHEVTP